MNVYDELAPIYDTRYLDADCLIENEVIRLLTHEKALGTKVLDVGAGTGLAIDLGIVPTGRYVGLDPSTAMLTQLVKKHPSVHGDGLFCFSFEDFVDNEKVPDDIGSVISLFGSPSYIPGEYMHRLFTIAPKVVTMHYVEGYWPEYEDKPATMDDSREEAIRICRSLGGASFRLNNFIVSVVG